MAMFLTFLILGAADTMQSIPKKVSYPALNVIVSV